MASVSDLLGKTLVRISGDDEELIFELDSGEKYKMYHAQDCCEDVRIEDICGRLDDLVGEPLTMADVVTSENEPEGLKRPEWQNDTYTWTFYKFATTKGYVTIRWFGTSNGYYSEDVYFEKTSKLAGAEKYNTGATP